MADENPANPSPDATPSPDPAPATPDPMTELRAQLAAQNAQIAALNDTVRAAITPRPVQSSAGAGGPLVTPELRAALRQEGMTDADIDHNSPIVMAYMRVYAQQFAGYVDGRVAPVNETMTLNEMAEDPEHFPFAKTLRADVRKLMADAKKDGRLLSAEAAYHTAVSQDISSGAASKIEKQRAEERAGGAGADAAATSRVGHRGSSSAGQRAAQPAAPVTAADLRAMTPEQRRDFYERVGDVPVTH